MYQVVSVPVETKAQIGQGSASASSGNYISGVSVSTSNDAAPTVSITQTPLPTIPNIPAVNNGNLALQINGTTQTNFTANQSGNSTFNVNVPPVRRYMGETIATFQSKVGNVYKFSVGFSDGSLSFSGGDYRAIRFTHADWTNVNDNVFAGMFLSLGSGWWSSAVTPSSWANSIIMSVGIDTNGSHTLNSTVNIIQLS